MNTGFTSRRHLSKVQMHADRPGYKVGSIVFPFTWDSFNLFYREIADAAHTLKNLCGFAPISQIVVMPKSVRRHVAAEKILRPKCTFLQSLPCKNLCAISLEYLCKFVRDQGPEPASCAGSLCFLLFDKLRRSPGSEL